MAEHAGDNVSFMDFINEMFYVSHHAHTFNYGRYGSFSMIFCLIVFLLTLIGKNQVVVTGARAGLMLWFHDVLPLLLPFMLLSNLFVLKIRTKKQAPPMRFLSYSCSDFYVAIRSVQRWLPTSRRKAISSHPPPRYCSLCVITSVQCFCPAISVTLCCRIGFRSGFCL